MSRFVQPLVYRPSRWSMQVSVAPTFEPVTVTDLKDQARIDLSDDDYLAEGLIQAARETVESMTRRAIITQTRILRIDDFPPEDHQVIELPGGKIQSVSSITYNDTDNATQTLSASIYDTDFGTQAGTGRVSLAADQDWPDTGEDGLNVTITYVAGWTTAALVPASIRRAILLFAAQMYRDREAFDQAAMVANPAFTALLAPWRVQRVG